MPSLLDLDTPTYSETQLSDLLAAARTRSGEMRSARRHHTLLAAVVVVALVAASSLVATVVAPPQRGRPSVGSLGRFRLLGDVSTWRLVSGNVLPSVALSCPSTTTCYAADQQTWSPGGLDQLEVTTDGGRSWTTSKLPVSLSFATRISCVDATTCALLGVTAAGSSVLLETTDGASSWTDVAGPSGLTSTIGVVAFDCTSASTCITVASTPGDAGPYSVSSYTTSDGGSVWTVTSMPAGFVPTALSCSTTGSCVTGGFSFVGGRAAPLGALYHSSNLGGSWTASTVPGELGAIGSLSCGDATVCLAANYANVRSGDMVEEDARHASNVFVSDDAGASFTRAAATGLSRGWVMDVSCPSATDCWSVGLEKSAGSSTYENPEKRRIFVPRAVGGDPGGFAASTDDGGQTWRAALLPDDLLALTNVSCPTAQVCFAIGILRSEGSGTGSQGLPFVLLSSAPDPAGASG